MSTAAITTRELRKTFHTPEGDLHAVDGVTFTIETGEVVAFLGRNGAGKTTTLDLIDIEMPGIDGIDATRALRHQCPRVAC